MITITSLLLVFSFFSPLSAGAQAGEIRWTSSAFEGLFPASKPVFVYLYSESCDPCARVGTELFIIAAIADFVNDNFIALKADISSPNGKMLSKAYQTMYTPTFLFFGGDKSELDRFSGFQDSETFLNSLKRVLQAKDAIGSYLAKLNQNPADTDVLFKLFQKYTDRSDIDNMLKYKALIEKADEIFFITHKEQMLNSLQRVYFSQRRYQDALKVTFTIIEQFPDTDLRIQYSFLASCYRYLQDNEKALAIHEKIIAQYPNDLSVYMNAVQFIVAADLDPDKALAIGLKSMAIKGSSTDKAEIAFQLSRIYAKKGLFPKALEMIDTAIAAFSYAPYSEYREDILDRMNGTTFRNLTAVEVKAVLDDAKVNKKRVLVIDVRTEVEFTGGHLLNALNIPVDSLAQRISEIAGFRNDYIVIYCAAGARSQKASRLLARSGFIRVLNMTDGFNQWKSSGFPQVMN